MTPRSSALLLVFLVALEACGGSSAASNSSTTHGDLTVFAASSLTQAFTKLGAVYEKQHAGSSVKFNFAASDTLATQITQGAPADVFAAASSDPMDTVTSKSLAAGKPRLFVSNRLVIVTPKGDAANIRAPRALAAPGVKLVLAAPGVPAGDYAREMLANLGLLHAAEKNIVSNEVDDKSVLSKVLFGNADAGIVYLTDLTPDVAAKVTAVRIPASENIVAHYPIVVLKDAADPVGAKSFVDLVFSARGQKILHDFGFGPP
jgi:molybdate transport system substrate-binding protein